MSIENEESEEKKLFSFSIVNRNSLHPMPTKKLRFPTTNQTIKERFTKSDMRIPGRKPILIRPILSWKISDFHPKPLNVLWHRLHQIADFPRTRKMMRMKTRTRHRQLRSISEPEVAAPPLLRKVSLKKLQQETFSLQLLRCSDPRFHFHQIFLVTTTLKS